MKITDIRTFHCSDGERNAIFLQVHTDEDVGRDLVVRPWLTAEGYGDF